MKRLYLVSMLVLAGVLHACNSSDTTTDQGKILTVTGAIDPSDLGTTLTHEHLLVDFIGADGTGYHRWNRDTVIRAVGPFLEEIQPLGVQSFVECTPAYLGRDPLLLKQLSEQTGIQILTNTGYYGARNNKFIPGEALELNAEALAAIWIDEFRNGIDGTGIRPGFIKIGVDANNIRAAERGAWISLDNVNAARDSNPGARFSTAWYVERIVAMKEAGLLDRLLISHDAGWYRPGEPGGGTFRGFTDIFTTLVPALEEQDFTDAEINQLMIVNPSKAFVVR
jgi:phosphotriesterase-related protein